MNNFEQRRLLLKGLLSSSFLGIASFLPKLALASWPKEAFQSKTISSAIELLEQGLAAEESKNIKIKAPKLAENGSIVWIEISTTLENVESISILVEKNPTPLAAKFVLAPGTEAYIYTRIKMRESSPVIALVKADGKLYSASRNIKVTLGGCGG
ncbi:MAG: thiosulfate oxidation carrier protein SoxY [Gammaproteobacteria bacterium]|nr:MAG: thiosulfate oxidation carrier protein SoxY [Gammaproteobacteria bacterium]RLA24329.1 MAG: thiosulfate oxidation carrier protein SoxY [Gammaproteobacteria bacterium]